MKKAIAISLFAGLISLVIINFGDAGHAVSGTIPAGPIEAPRLVWEAEPVEGEFKDPPVLIDGRLIAVSESGENLYVNSFDADTGRLLWSRMFEATSLMGLEGSDGLVFLTIRYSHPEEGEQRVTLTTLGVVQGDTVWEVDELAADWKSGAAEVIDVTEKYVYLSYNDGSAGAVDRITGESVWRKGYSDREFSYGQLGGDLVGPVNLAYSVAVIADKLLVMGSEGITAVDRYSGDTLWNYWDTGLVLSAPKESNGSMYFSGHEGSPSLRGTIIEKGILGSIDIETGKEEWRFERSNGTWGAPTIVGDIIVAAAVGRWRSVECRDECGVLGQSVFSGEQKWLTGKNVVDFKLTGPGVAIARQFGNRGAGIRMVDIQSGKDIWRADLDSDQTSHMVLSDEAIYVATDEWNLGIHGSVRAIDPNDGHQMWRWPDESSGEPSKFAPASPIGFLVTDPAIGDGMLFAVGEDTIYALR